MNQLPKIHRLSHATTYLETYVVRQDGQHEYRSFATGFFVRKHSKLYLTSNWHVFTGLDPANTTESHPKGPPHYIKATVRNKDGKHLSILSIPLYSNTWSPLWLEHAEGPVVDLAILELPNEVEERFQISAISLLVDQHTINSAISRDVYILGYPFDGDHFAKSFGNAHGHELPIWKRGSIASEPEMSLGGRVVLIDSLSRPGMSGSPVVIAEDHDMMTTNDSETIKALKDETLSPLERVMQINVDSMRSVRERHFNFFGIYSGVIGLTKGNDVALGKCWTSAALQELLDAPVGGAMPHHGPSGEHVHYQDWLSTFNGVLVMRDQSGQTLERIELAEPAANKPVDAFPHGSSAATSLYRASYQFTKNGLKLS
jgi:hypothetical protein